MRPVKLVCLLHQNIGLTVIGHDACHELVTQTLFPDLIGTPRSSYQLTCNGLFPLLYALSEWLLRTCAFGNFRHGLPPGVSSRSSRATYSVLNRTMWNCCRSFYIIYLLRPGVRVLLEGRSMNSLPNVE